MTTPPSSAAGERIVALLDRLGYRATLHLRAGLLRRRPSPATTGTPDSPAGEPTTRPPPASCRPSAPATPTWAIWATTPARYCDPAIERADRGGEPPADHRSPAASDAWATIDRKLVDAAATIPYGNSVHHYFVGDRVGNTLMHPMTGPLIAQMWVQ